jgi:phage terminase large subunit
MTESNPFIEFAERYHDDPVGFVRNVLGVEPDPWQIQLLEWIKDGERQISVRSGHGVGKTTGASFATVWIATTRAPFKVVVTAPSAPQLYDALFAEIKKWCNRLPPALAGLLEVKAERIEHKGAPEEMFITARTSRAENPEALQGIHADGGMVFLVADEASGIPEPVFEAAAGSMSGANCCTLLLGNPTRLSGLFFETHHKLKQFWKTLKVSCLDSIRVSKQYVEEMKTRYGEDSNAFRVRVLGEFPKRSDDTVIPLEIIEAATMRDIVIDPKADEVWGLDVARFGNDSSALTKRKGKVVPTAPKVWKGLDTMQLTGALVAEYNVSEQKPKAIMVDVIGIGAGVVDRARELKLPVIGINVSEAPSTDGVYLNLRAELWYKGKAWLEALDCKLPNDDRLVYELSGPKYSFQSNGVVKVESKADMKKRGLQSPDVADSFLLTFAVDASALAGFTAGTQSWGSALKRKIKGIV